MITLTAEKNGKTYTVRFDEEELKHKGVGEALCQYIKQQLR